ncbi:hypothetical protein LTR36_005784 [Oleoguttula mirabilis]|uniref:non-specific serine/threonine protein kinase n=1 Tax=Oleoguttula mirabilis TaxID=1507867 RepID=A0AAV9JEN0_9PEZI|nr:hypothetical protein LTR36_005784 [Oleoguttula mirabilis]
MNADLSLGQSLGGLRIANPDDDDDAMASPASTADPSTRPPPPSSPSSDTTVTDARTTGLLPTLPHERAVQEEEGLGFNPNHYSLQNTRVSPNPSNHSRSSSAVQDDWARSGVSQGQSMGMAMPQQPQQAMQYTAQPLGYGQQPRNLSAPNTVPRPISSMYMQPDASSGSNTSAPGSYRYRDDMGSSDGSTSGMTRSGSRAARGMVAGALGREGSRTYRQGSQPMIGGNGPLPPRRNSRRARAPTVGSDQGCDGPDVPYNNASAPMPSTAEEWRERGAVSATQQVTDSNGQTHTRIVKKGVKDFNFGRTLGEGSYSTVLAATDRQNLKEYAIKVLDKRHIIKEKKVKYVNIERDTLNRLTEHPGIVRLYYTFQDERSLYFVLDLASGGELLGVLKKMGSFDVECTRFYGAEILDSVAYMHARGVIHRDLKPENVLLDREMHVKITDFGTAKILPDPLRKGAGSEAMAGDPTDGAELDRAVSFVGTAEYVSPELLRDKNACKASDLWAFGCIIYQLLAGRPPFKAANEYLTFQKILALDYSFPEGFPEVARDLVERLLVLDPANRLPVEHIRNHQFFEGIQWTRGLWRQKAPRLKAYVPPPAEPIKLGGGANKSTGGLSAASSAPAIGVTSPVQSQASSSQAQLNNGRPQLRGVTDLPPPSQLDIDWSPVLTHNNERILKLGNLIVFTGPQAQSPSGKSSEPGTPSEKPKFSRFFSGNTSKKRERLVLITSSARLIIAAAGGNEKKAKMEVNLLASGTSWKSFVDSKGLTAWSLDNRDKHLTFDDPRATTSDPAGSKYSTQEWLESVSQARELALAQSMTGSYSGASLLDSGSTADSLGGGDAAMPMPSGPNLERHAMRQTLRKNTDEYEASKGRKRFSKRHSKSGLAAVF